MKKIFSSVFTLMFVLAGNSYAADLGGLILQARDACSGISDAMSDLKKMAGINTAVTAVGTVAGGVALGTGIAKMGVDNTQHDLEAKIQKLIEEKKNITIEKMEIRDPVKFKQDIQDVIAQNQKLSEDIDEVSRLEKKSKTLGHVRTGTLAASTATNVAGTVIASKNKVDEGLEEKVNKCISVVKELTNAKLAAKVEGTATEAEIAQADKIVSHCRDWELVDLKPINKRAKGAAVSSGIGIGTGVFGTIISAVANTDKTRSGDERKEKNLNMTANVMAGASTAASATATIFNATQISAIKKAVVVADECEGALR